MTNPKTGRVECVFVDLQKVYPDPQDPSVEYCFEELRASHRGWLRKDWKAIRREVQAQKQREKARETTALTTKMTTSPAEVSSGVYAKPLANHLQETLRLNDETDENGAPVVRRDADLAKKMRKEERANRTRKIKVKEIKAETQKSK